MKTPEEIFNEIPFLSICEEGKWYQLPKKEVIEAIKKYATQCQQDNAERKLTDKIFDLANELAVAGYGNEAVFLHNIRNRMIK